MILGHGNSRRITAHVHIRGSRRGTGGFGSRDPCCIRLCRAAISCLKESFLRSYIPSSLVRHYSRSSLVSSVLFPHIMVFYLPFSPISSLQDQSTSRKIISFQNRLLPQQLIRRQPLFPLKTSQMGHQPLRSTVNPPHPTIYKKRAPVHIESMIRLKFDSFSKGHVLTPKDSHSFLTNRSISASRGTLCIQNNLK